MVSPHIIWIGLVLLTVGLCGVVKFWPEGGSSKTFSQHVSHYKSGVLYYILLFTVTLPLFGVFFLGWFAPTYNLSILFSISIIIALVTQYLCTFIPEVGNRRKVIHRGLAFISALGLLLAVLAALFSGSFSVIERVVLGVGLIVMALLLGIMAYTRANNARILYIQAGYFVVFFTSILLVAYF